jgi:hypothetical protein
VKTVADLLKLLMPGTGKSSSPSGATAAWRADRRARPLGVVVAKDPAPIALAEKRKTDDMLPKVRGGNDGQWDQLPGTRVEAVALRQLCGKAKLTYRLLADSDASEQEPGPTG